MRTEAVEPEVLHPDDPGPRIRQAERPVPARLGIVGMLLCGLMIDGVDLVTRDPKLGLAAGAAAGLYVCAARLRLPPKAWLWWAAVSGVYCGFGNTQFIPAATVFMFVLWAGSRLRRDRRRRDDEWQMTKGDM